MAKLSIIGNFSAVKNLVGKPYCSLELVKQTMHVPLPAEYLSNVKNAVMIVLQDELEIYSPELNGVPVAFNKRTVKLIERYGSVMSAQPYIHCDVSCEFVVFKPKVNDLLHGIVNKSTGSSIGCLIHHCFYATIHCHEGKKKKREEDIKIGDTIFIRVMKLQEDGNGVLSIIASFHDSEIEMAPGLCKPEDQISTQGADSGIENIDNDAENNSMMAHDGTNNSQLYSAQSGIFSDTGVQSDSLLSPFTKEVNFSKSKKFINPNEISLKKENHTSATDSSKAGNSRKRKHKHSKVKPEIDAVPSDDVSENKMKVKKEHKKSKKKMKKELIIDESGEKVTVNDSLNEFERPEIEKTEKRKRHKNKKDKVEKEKSEHAASIAGSSELSEHQDAKKSDKAKRKKENPQKKLKSKMSDDLKKNWPGMFSPAEKKIQPVPACPESPINFPSVECWGTQDTDKIEIKNVVSLATEGIEPNLSGNIEQLFTSVEETIHNDSPLVLVASEHKKTNKNKEKKKKKKKLKKDKRHSSNNSLCYDVQTNTLVQDEQVIIPSGNLGSEGQNLFGTPAYLHQSYIKQEEPSADDENAKTNLMSWLAETMQDVKASVKSENVEDTPVGARLDPADGQVVSSKEQRKVRKAKKKAKKEKKNSEEIKRKKKREAGISVSSPPPVKRVKPDYLNDLSSTSQIKFIVKQDPSSPVQNRDQFEHHKQALFHLKELGIDLPLSALLAIKTESSYSLNQSSSFANTYKEQCSSPPPKHWSPGNISTTALTMTHPVTCIQEAKLSPMPNTASTNSAKSKRKKKNKKQKKEPKEKKQMEGLQKI